MTTTYLFYDLETTGLSKTFDQVMQFAGIRTDTNLNELERHEYLVKLNPDTIPSPEASITHRISIAQCADGLPEITAMEKIHQLLNTPGTISLGYNTLGFDDEFLRFSFYRNLLPPYTHQFANQCYRADLYPMTLLYYLFNKDALRWPEIDGRVSLKLENLSQENALATGQAHNAMVDVKATIALAKRLKQHDKMWQYLMGHFNKATDTKRIQQLPTAFDHYQYGLYIDGKIGYRDNFAAPALLLGQHYHYKNQTVWLRLDAPQLRDTKLNDIGKTTWCFNKKQAEPGFLLPPTDHYLGALSSERQAELQSNLTWLSQHPEILKAIIEHHCDFTYPVVDRIDIDAALYTNGFPSREDTHQCAELHRATAARYAEQIDHFTNPNFRQLAIRAIGRLDKNHLSPSQRQQFDRYLATALSPENDLIDFKGHARITVTEALQRIQALKQQTTLDQAQQALLDELAHYLQSSLREGR